jgi:hypothetical protein
LTKLLELTMIIKNLDVEEAEAALEIDQVALIEVTAC